MLPLDWHGETVAAEREALVLAETGNGTQITIQHLDANPAVAGVGVQNPVCTN